VITSLPQNTIEISALGLAFAITQKSRERLSVLQIGACDGKVGDPLYHQLHRGAPINAILVEPIPANFEALKKSYSGLQNVSFLNIAIAHEDGRAVIYTVKNEGRWAGSEWAPQWASFQYDHLLKHGVLPNEIEEQTVQTCTLQTLMENSRINFIDFLMIDTEGFDAAVVTMALKFQQQPRFICFEHLHLRSDEFEPLFQKLHSNNYRWISDRMNTLAIKIA